MHSVSEMTEVFKSKYMKLWWHTPTRMPQLGELYTKSVKAANEKETDVFVKEMVNRLKKMPAPGLDQSAWHEEFMYRTREFAGNVLCFKKEYLDIIFGEGFIKSTSCFVKKARSFAPGMKLEDIFQAIRNVWIMNSIQVFLDMDVNFSPSVFAYSMLYPYTDNYLDSTQVDSNEKTKISSRFRKRLAGEQITPCGAYERDLFMLVQIIESQYDRIEYKELYESLLGIHDAQQNSLLQQSKRTVPYEVDILGISFQKGGISVLADAYMVSGTLERQAAEFMFGFGIILQLADDLQDVAVDAENGHLTLFSQIAGKWPLDTITNKLLNFISDTLDFGKCSIPSASQYLRELIKYNCNFLIIQAIARNGGLYTVDYLKEIEQYSIYSFKYMKKLYEKLKKEYISFEKGKKGLSLEDTIHAAIDSF